MSTLCLLRFVICLCLCFFLPKVHLLIIMSRIKAKIFWQRENFLIHWFIKRTCVTFLEVGTSTTTDQECVASECDALNMFCRKPWKREEQKKNSKLFRHNEIYEKMNLISKFATMGIGRIPMALFDSLLGDVPMPTNKSRELKWIHWHLSSFSTLEPLWLMRTRSLPLAECGKIGRNIWFSFLFRNVIIHGKALPLHSKPINLRILRDMTTFYSLAQ